MGFPLLDFVGNALVPVLPEAAIQVANFELVCFND
jgi:hypothetical protein